MDHAFKIHLPSVIDVLSQHLDGGPQSFVRELIQNSVDAIRARNDHDPDHAGSITIEILGGRAASLAFIDDGIGLDEEEVHRLIATIGRSSRHSAESHLADDFLGRFGIGLLSCFAVSDEIALVTRSARPGPQRTIEWRGRRDGTYSVKILDREIAPGTQVYLTSNLLWEPYFTFAKISELANRFAGMLPNPIHVVAGRVTTIANVGGRPWRRRFASTEQQTRELLEFGRQTFGVTFLDAIPLKSKVGSIEGVAFVLPDSPNLATRPMHRAYLKGMLLSEDVAGLLPDWAHFVRCVVNAEGLRSTASREAFARDQALDEARESIGRTLRDYLVGLATRDQAKLRQVIVLHALSLKCLAILDDEFFRMFVDWLPFPTTMGVMSLGDYRRDFGPVRYVTDVDRLCQVTRIATAQNLCLIVADLKLDSDLLARLPEIVDGVECERVDPADLAPMLDDLNHDEMAEMDALISLADQVLGPFQCAATARKFLPEELPALFCPAADGVLQGSNRSTHYVWDFVLPGSAEPLALLTFNYGNPLIRRVAAVSDRVFQERSVEVLYIQALLLGGHPLSAREAALVNTSTFGLIAWGVSARVALP